MSDRTSKTSKLGIKVTAVLIAASVMLSACSPQDIFRWPPGVLQPQSGSSEEDQITSLGLTPDLDYERPVIEAHIEVDQLGYLPDSRKMAIFRGDELDDLFYIVSE